MPDHLLRRRLMQAMAGAVAGSALPAAGQSDWPTRPMRMVTGAPAGDPPDLVVRRFANAATAELNQQNIVVENKPGAGGVLAHQDVLRSPADGYTLLHGNASITILPAINRKLGYNPLTDLVPAAFLGMSALGLAIPASRPEKTFAEWLAWARQHKGGLGYGSGGNGSVQHLYGWQLADQMGLDASHVPYRGVGPALRDLIADRVQFMVVDTFTLRTFVAAGQLRLLAVTGNERSRYLPDTPTFREVGAENFDRMGWNAWYFKTGTPAPIVERLAAVANRINARPDWVALREQMWIDWRPMTLTEVAGQVRRETEAWAQVVRKSGYVHD